MDEQFQHIDAVDLRILRMLESRGRMYVAEIHDELAGPQMTAVAQRLKRMLRDDLLDMSTTPPGDGKPARKYYRMRNAGLTLVQAYNLAEAVYAEPRGRLYTSWGKAVQGEAVDVPGKKLLVLALHPKGTVEAFGG